MSRGNGWRVKSVSPAGAPDETSDEFEPFKELEYEAERIVRHPHVEAERLHLIAEEGESGATPFIEIVSVARWVIPLLLLMVALMLGVYFAARRWG